MVGGEKLDKFEGLLEAVIRAKGDTPAAARRAMVLDEVGSDAVAAFAHRVMHAPARVSDATVRQLVHGGASEDAVFEAAVAAAAGSALVRLRRGLALLKKPLPNVPDV